MGTRALILFAAVCTCPSFAFAQAATFDALSLTPSSYWINPTSGTASFTNGGVTFVNTADYNYVLDNIPFWSGWAYSNMADRSTPGPGNPFSAITGTGVHGSANYAVGYPDFDSGEITLNLPSPTTVLGGYFTNTAYAYWSMYYGDGFGKAFSGTDSFTVTISGQNAAGHAVGTPVDINLATGRNFLDTWKWTDLSALGPNVSSLTFDFFSTDYGDFGPNTPTYVAMDTLALAAASPALHWTGSGAASNWSSSASWGGASVTPSAALSFSGSAGLASVNDLPPGTTIGGMQFEAAADAFNISGNSVALAGNLSNFGSQTQTIDLGIQLTSDVTIIDPLDGNLVLHGPLSGSGELIKVGPQTLVLSGTNSYAGGTFVEEGTLEILTAAALADGSSLTVGDSGIFDNPTPPVETAPAVAAVPEPSALTLLIALVAILSALIRLASLRRLA